MDIERCDWTLGQRPGEIQVGKEVEEMSSAMLNRILVTATLLPLGACDGRLPAADTDAGGDVHGSAEDAGLQAFIEVDCSPTIPAVGRFLPRCQYTDVTFEGETTAAPTAECERLNDAGGWVGRVEVNIRHPERVVLGAPAPVGGNDPTVTISVASGSVAMDLVQAIPGSEAGSIVLDEMVPGSRLRGRFADVRFTRYPNPPGYPCRLSNAEFSAERP